MDPLDFLDPPQLLRFLRRHKTELACVEQPRTLLSQLRDHDLIPEDRYQVRGRGLTPPDPQLVLR